MNPPTVHKCPECNGEHFKRLALPHPLLLHWILNPGLVFNELVLGQRLPKTTLICLDCEGPLMNRQYVPCPFCGAMHSGLNGKFFALWRGARCACCDRPIPLLWNVFSALILGLTYPVWGLPYHLHFQKKNLPLLGVSRRGTPQKNKRRPLSFFWAGVLWGGLMWLVTGVLPVWRNEATPARWDVVFGMLPIWAAGGSLFGFLLWFFIGRSRKPNPTVTPNDG